MTEMVERVARVLLDADGISFPSGRKREWNEIPDGQRAAYSAIARAAIAAMREPTEGMKFAGRTEKPFLAPQENWTPGQIVADAVYRAMIDAALAEGK